MSDNELKQYIESDCDCDMALLDIAVNKGLHRAKNERADVKKFLNLAAMCAVTFAICITSSLTPIKIASKDLLLNNSLVTQIRSEILYDYLNDITSKLLVYLRGD